MYLLSHLPLQDGFTNRNYTICHVSQYSSYLRDISQAYVKSDGSLQRPVFLKPLPKMKIPDDMAIQAVKILYGIPEAGLYWFLTYSEHHIDNLGMKSTAYDPCVLYKRVGERH